MATLGLPLGPAAVITAILAAIIRHAAGSALRGTSRFPETFRSYQSPLSRMFNSGSADKVSNLVLLDAAFYY